MIQILLLLLFFILIFTTILFGGLWVVMIRFGVFKEFITWEEFKDCVKCLFCGHQWTTFCSTTDYSVHSRKCDRCGKEQDVSIKFKKVRRKL